MPGFASGAMSGAAAGSAAGPWGALVGGIAGGILGSAEGDNGARDRQLQQELFAEKQFKFQEELAHNGVRYRVEDAKRAMIHPAAALGMQPFNPSPVSLNFGESHQPDNSWMAQAGHNMTRAAAATMTASEREQNTALASLAMERAGLENDLLRARIRKEQIGPPMVDPSDPGVRTFGTSDARIVEKPLERIAGFVGRGQAEAGVVTDYGYSKTDSGYAIVPSKDWKDRGEDQLAPEFGWAMRNVVRNTYSPKPPPDSFLPDGAIGWRFNVYMQEFQPVFPKVQYKGRIGDSYSAPASRRRSSPPPSLWTGAP